MRILVIGGGAAGFFAALSARRHHPAAQVVLVEKSDKLLAKVRISGGGRCNVTHHQLEPRKLAKSYPRGEAFLRAAFKRWSVRDTIAWFAAAGVELKVEADGRMFPSTDSSATIVDCLEDQAAAAGVEVRKQWPVERLERNEAAWVATGRAGTIMAEKVIVANGGSPRLEGLAWLQALGQPIVAPVPSLFTFNLPNDPITGLMGVVAPAARVRIEGMALEATGPVLVTHWGLSGPAVLRVSAWGARVLAAAGYMATVRINWAGARSEEEVKALLAEEQGAHPQRTMAKVRVLDLPARLWDHLLQRAEIAGGKAIGDMGRHDLNRLVALITNDAHAMQGKTTFKEEFVTAGGVDLAGVDPQTMSSRHQADLYYAGEVLDIDGITGGFNFQAAWTTGWIAGACGASVEVGR